MEMKLRYTLKDNGYNVHKKRVTTSHLQESQARISGNTRRKNLRITENSQGQTKNQMKKKITISDFSIMMNKVSSASYRPHSSVLNLDRCFNLQLPPSTCN